MADDIQFSNNHRDLSIRAGTGAGYQFEFFCQCCNDTWRSPFSAYRSGQVSGWLQKVQSALGGLTGPLGNAVGRAASGVAEAGWGEGRDAAFRAAIESARGHFQRCGKCQRHACVRCWNTELGLCRLCVPHAAAEIEAARHRGAVDAARTQAYQQGSQQSRPEDPHPAVGACAHCQAALPPGSRFCPACGERTAATT